MCRSLIIKRNIIRRDLSNQNFKKSLSLIIRENMRLLLTFPCTMQVHCWLLISKATVRNTVHWSAVQQLLKYRKLNYPSINHLLWAWTFFIQIGNTQRFRSQKRQQALIWSQTQAVFWAYSWNWALKAPIDLFLVHLTLFFFDFITYLNNLQLLVILSFWCNICLIDVLVRI